MSRVACVRYNTEKKKNGYSLPEYIVPIYTIEAKSTHGISLVWSVYDGSKT